MLRSSSVCRNWNRVYRELCCNEFPGCRHNRTNRQQYYSLIGWLEALIARQLMPAPNCFRFRACAALPNETNEKLNRFASVQMSLARCFRYKRRVDGFCAETVTSNRLTSTLTAAPFDAVHGCELIFVRWTKGFAAVCSRERLTNISRSLSWNSEERGAELQLKGIM